MSLAAVALAGGCDFGSTRTLVTSGQIASITAVSANTDADTIFMGDATGRMAQADADTGIITGSMVLWGGVNSTPVGIAPDGEDPSRVWALHDDGFLVNWQSGPSLVQWYWPPPIPPDGRDYCDIAQADDGDLYVTTVDAGVGNLWRRNDATGVWSSTALLGDSQCGHVAADLLSDRLFVLRDDGFTLDRRDPDTLASMGSVILDVDGGVATDVHVIGELALAAGQTSAPSGPPPSGFPPIPAMRMAWQFNPLSGGEAGAAKIIGGALASAVGLSANADTQTAEMLVSSAAGTQTLRAIELTH